MYRQKKVTDEGVNSDREFSILSTMLSPEELEVMRFFKYDHLEERREDD